MAAPIEIYASEDIDLLFTILDENGIAKDLSTASTISWVYVPKGRETLKVTLSGAAPFASGDVTWYDDGTDGKFYVHIESTDWTDLTSGSPTGTQQCSVVLDGKRRVVSTSELRLGADYF